MLQLSGKWLALGLALIALAVGPVLAQETTAGIQGTVRDATGGSVAGATVEVTGPSLIGIRKVTTDDAGAYRIIIKEDALSAGSLLGRGAVDAIILDVERANDTATRIIEEVRAHDPECPLLVFAGHGPRAWEEVTSVVSILIDGDFSLADAAINPGSVDANQPRHLGDGVAR